MQRMQEQVLESADPDQQSSFIKTIEETYRVTVNRRSFERDLNN
jgi:hypothetical protein